MGLILSGPKVKKKVRGFGGIFKKVGLGEVSEKAKKPESKVYGATFTGL